MKDNITFANLKNSAANADENMPEYKIFVMGDCSTQHLAVALKGLAAKNNIYLNIKEANYDQIQMQVFDDNSELYQFAPDSALIFMCTEKLYDEYCKTDLSERKNFAQEQMDKIALLWKISSKIKVNIIQYNFTQVDDSVFGSFANSVEDSFLFQLRKLNFMLAEKSVNEKNVYIADLDSVKNLLGANVFSDYKMYYHAKLAVSLKALPYAAKKVVDIINAQKGKSIKCVVLDLDNTLWGGVIGDDGVGGIELGDYGTGPAFVRFQKWLKELKNRGILLAICSKNEEDAAKKPFLEHEDCVLKLEDFSIFVANWNNKADNIKFIAQSLNLGLDSFLFIDDNPFERRAVKSMVPQVIVPEMPSDPAQYLSYLQGLNLFEALSFSAEDKTRTELYRAQAQRNILQASFENFDDYLKSLQMKCEVKPFDKEHVGRISQLTLRSNQFNLRTIRYTENDIDQIAQNDKYITSYFILNDKFGNHGLISILILEKQQDCLFIDTWLMSCRVLKRGMEEFCINKVREIAENNGYKKVVGEYLKTEKNAMVKNIYERLGFEKVSDTTFVLNTDIFEKNKTLIEEI